MTEAEWLVSTEPQKMLDSLFTGPMRGGYRHPADCVSDRKLRHFACACVRAVENGVECGVLQSERACAGGRPFTHFANCPDCHGTDRVGGLTDERSRRAVDVSERYADGLATEEDMRKSWLQACSFTPANEADRLARYAALNPDSGFGWMTSPMWREGRFDSLIPPATQASYLRCIFGNPWKSVESPWAVFDDTDRLPGKSWLTSTVLSIAENIYQERRFEDLGILADALEEAGCLDEQILNHCRSGEPHVKGCWCLDLLTGRQ